VVFGLLRLDLMMFGRVVFGLVRFTRFDLSRIGRLPVID
jgi:hypothetical protein